MNRISNITLAGTILAILVSTTSATSQTNGASVQGVITDSASWVIPGAKITAMNRDTGTSSSTISDANGKYAFSGLTDGDYVFSAFLQGFSTNEIRRSVAKDSAVQQNFILRIGQEFPDMSIVPDPFGDQEMVIRPSGNYR